MAGIPWTPEERADAVACQSWEDFIGKGWSRSYDSWEKQRRMERCRGKLGPAPEPVYETPAPEPPNIERYFDLMTELREEERKFRPIQSHLKIRLDVDRPIAVCFVSDLHIGGDIEYGRLRDDIKRMADIAGCYFVLGGDLCNNFGAVPKLEHAGRGDAPLDIQWRLASWVVKTLYETGRLLLVSSGNHDAWSARAAGHDHHLEFLREFPHLRYAGEGGLIDLTVGRTTYRIFRKHRPPRSSRLNPFHAAQVTFREPPCEGLDIVVTEHLHNPAAASWIHAGKRVACAQTGTYKVRDPHAWEFGFWSTAIGTPSIVLWPDRRDIAHDDDLEKVSERLSQWWSTTDETA